MPNYKPEWIDRHPEVDMNATDLARKYTHK
jgi:hypothetical protein